MLQHQTAKLAFRPFALPLLLSILIAPSLSAGDWPMWRYDSGRSAGSETDLPETLEWAWTHQFDARQPTWDDPLNNDLMSFDRVFEPIIVGNRVVVGFNDSDKVVCWDVNTGRELWRFYTDGPVRMPPAAAPGGDRVFVASDDGYLYCLQLSSGKQLWRKQGGPDNRKVLGNRRIISMWPARGGPVVRDQNVYFAASIWPFMGTFIYALDAESGDVAWVNDRTASTYIKQPHSAPSFAGVAPQGSLVATKDSLIVPGGRSVPAVLDRSTGELTHFELNAGGKGNGGSTVIADDEYYYVHTRDRGMRRFNLKTAKKTALMLNEPISYGGLLWTSDAESIRAIKSNENGTEQEVVWRVAVDGQYDLIRAGRRLYAAGKEGITVVQLPAADQITRQQPEVVATHRIGASTDGKAGTIRRLVAGGQHLLAVTDSGSIHAYGLPAKTKRIVDNSERDALGTTVEREAYPGLQPWLQHQHVDQGYGLVFGPADRALLDCLLDGTQLQLTVVIEDAQQIAKLRRHYDDRGLYGDRVTIHQGTPETFQAPPYIASLVVDATDSSVTQTPERLQAMYRSVRPYGGLLWFAARDAEGAGSQQLVKELNEANLPRAQLLDLAEGATQTQGSEDVKLPGRFLRRVGALPGAAAWTHMYGDVANTVKSNDRRVKAPLGLLWFGGNSHEDVLPRHGHAPAEQVIGGRLFVEGMNSMSARDVYTGRQLWQRKFSDLGTFEIYYDGSYRDTPLSTNYNQVHLPGANARGTNFVATEDGIYLVMADRCVVLDPATGETLRTMTLPREVNPEGKATWTYIGIQGDYLIAGVDFANREDAKKVLGLKEMVKKRGPAWSPAWFASRKIVVLNRSTGKLLWHRTAEHSFMHNGIVAGERNLFLLDKLPASIEKQRARRGQARPEDYRLLAVRLADGQPQWEQAKYTFGTWLGYSQPHDILLHAGAGAPDRALDETNNGIVALRGDSGDQIWHNGGLEYSGPCIIHNDRVIMNSRSYAVTSGVFRITDGQPVLQLNPLSGKEEAWTYRRAYGCNTAIASEHLLTFRSGAAGYYDLDSKCGVANLGGFRSGCTSNLIAADGVLNAPDFTRTCSCGYQNQTSLALIHMPDVDVWTVNPFAGELDKADVRRLGINFGAAGTRRADDGTVWVEYPAATDAKFPLKIKVSGEQLAYTRQHSSRAPASPSWVFGSTVRGVQRVDVPVNARRGDAKYDVTLYLASETVPNDLTVGGNQVSPDDFDPTNRTLRVPAVQLRKGKLRIRCEAGVQLAGIQLIAN